MSSTALAHLRALAVDIGPRGSTTPEERQAAAYAQHHFTTLGLSSNWEDFTSPTTGWRQFSFAAILGLVSLALFWAGGQIGSIIAGLVSLVTIISIFREMYSRPNLLGVFVRKRRSQNVWARIPAADNPIRRVLLVGHIDTHRTPWVFSSPARLRFFRVMTTLTLVAFVFSTVIYLLSVFVTLDALRWLALFLALPYLITLAMTWQADLTPYTRGANDNASGVAVVLSLAEHLAHAPLQRIEVWALCSGCEEVGSRGVYAFVEQHRAELPGFLAINVDNVGGRGAGICYARVEGMLTRYKPSPELLRLADQITADRPDLNAYSQAFTAMHTDATCLMANGVPSLSFLGLTPDGRMPNWHQRTDTFEQIDAKTVESTEEFIWELLHRLDAEPHA